MPSHDGDGATKPSWQRLCQSDLAAVECRYQVMLATMRPSHAGDGAAEVTWPRHDVDVES
jgi:hypothetical protein